MSGVAFQIAVIVLLVILNGVFAMSETALVSSRRARLRQRAEGGNAGARAALGLAKDPNRFLSTVQIGISLIGVLAGAFGGAALAGPLAEALGAVPAVAPYAEAVAFAVVVGAITYLSLVVGELVPKRLALGAPEAVASLVARPMNLLSVLASPVVWFLGASTNLVLRLLRISPAAEAPVSEQEVEILLEEGARAGVFEAEESDLARRALALDETPARELMTPRTRVAWLDADASPEEHRRVVAGSRRSWLPVARGGLDDVLGIASAKDAWARPDETGPTLLDSLVSPPILPEGAPASRALAAFKRSGVPFVQLVDERGYFEGIVTPADVLEALVGDVGEEGEADGEAPGLTRRPDGSLLVDGLLAAGELKGRLGLSGLPREDGEDYQTVGGMAMAALRRVPAEGDAFSWEGWRFEVLDMDGNRVDKVLVAPAPETGPPERPAARPPEPGQGASPGVG